LNVSGGKYSGRSGKSVSGDERAIPDVQKSHMAWCVTRRKNGLKGADAVTVVEKDRRSKISRPENRVVFFRIHRDERKIVLSEKTKPNAAPAPAATYDILPTGMKAIQETRISFV